LTGRTLVEQLAIVCMPSRRRVVLLFEQAFDTVPIAADTGQGELDARKHVQYTQQSD
jgi:hypothetical protein